MSKRGRMILWAFVSAAVVAVIAAAIAGPIMSRVEQPEYQVTSSEGSTACFSNCGTVISVIHGQGFQ